MFLCIPSFSACKLHCIHHWLEVCGAFLNNLFNDVPIPVSKASPNPWHHHLYNTALLDVATTCVDVLYTLLDSIIGDIHYALISPISGLRNHVEDDYISLLST